VNFGRILDALLRGSARPRRRAPARGGFGMTQTQTRQLGRALGTLASAAAEAMSGANQTPAPKPAARKPQAQPDRISPAKPAPARRIPDVAAPSQPQAGVETAEARLMLRAMIAAAKADGIVDREERTAVLEQLNAAGLSSAERDLLLADFDRPATPEDLARDVRDPMLAAQVYAAAFFAAGDLETAERAWLDRLGIALKLDNSARSAIEMRLGG
jgi:uncharacterized membrane protein YebE (DUF533 family)